MYHSNISEDAAKRIKQCVSVCRAARNANSASASRRTGSDARREKAEAESIQRAAQTLYEHASLNQMKPSFVSCEIAKSSALALDSDTESSSSGTEDSETTSSLVARKYRRGKRGTEPMIYVLTVNFTNTQQSEKKYMAACDVGAQANKALRDVFNALAQRGRSKNSVLYQELSAEFDAQRNLYEIKARMWPPADRDTQSAPVVAASSLGKRKAETKPEVAVSAQECIDFYTKNPDLWAVFGNGIVSDLSKNRKKVRS